MTRTSKLASLTLLVAIALTHLFAGRAVAASGGSASVPLLVRTKVDLTPEVIASIGARTVRVIYAWSEIRAMAITMNESKIRDLAADPRIDVIEADGTGGAVPVGVDATGTAVSIDPILAPTQSLLSPVQTWNQDMADTPGSGYTGAGVTVAVVDAGLPQNWQEFLPADCVDLEHAAGFGAEGWGDPHSQVNAIHGVGGHIGLFPHGLAVSSVIVGFPSEFGLIGGAAPGVKILPVRVLNSFNYGWFSWFAAGIMHVANLKASGAIPGPMVINFSIQATESSQILTAAIDYAIAHGVLFVTVAGNLNPAFNVSFPGNLPQSITAGAVGWRGEGLAPQPWFFGDVPENDASQAYVAPFSGRESPSVPAASQIDVVAPGSFVFGEWLFGSGFSEGRSVGFDAVDNFIFGTSFAAPHVVGIVAQMLEKNPGLSQAQAEGILRSTALPVPPSPALFFTPLGVPVEPWDSRATGAGLVRGDDAVTSTPAAAVVFGGAAAGAMAARIQNGGRGAGDGVSLRRSSALGKIPVRFEFSGAKSAASEVAIFDLQGRLVRHWTEAAGATVSWDGRREDGTAVGSGLYFLRVESAGLAARAKVVVAR